MRKKPIPATIEEFESPREATKQELKTTFPPGYATDPYEWEAFEAVTSPDARAFNSDFVRRICRPGPKSKVFVIETADGSIRAHLRAAVRDVKKAGKRIRVGYVVDFWVELAFISMGPLEKEYDYRGKLLSKALEWFKSKKVREVALYVMADHERAVRAWRKNGFRFVAHYMERRL